VPPTQAPAANTTSATIQVETVDAEGNPVAGACYELILVDGTEQIDCGIAIGGDATDALFANIPAGSYELVPVGIPAGYGLPGPQEVTVAAGQSQTLTVTAPLAEPVVAGPNSATIVLVPLDVASGELAIGTCFQLDPVDDSIEPIVSCVASGAGGAAAGPLTFVIPAPNSYILTAVKLPPDAVLDPASYEIRVTPGQTFTWVSRIVAASS
jgi:hypothetical protein